jgi:glycosyltransferase involved in cell wall biosynthesis
MIEHSRNGLLAGFSDLDALTERALEALDDPALARRLGEAGAEMIRERYSLEKCLPQAYRFFEQVANAVK